jgi:large conductance mechanosensitive channel
MLSEFKQFVMRGNVLDMAVGIIIGAAFGTIVSSLVADVLMPPIGLALGGIDFTNMFATLKDGAKQAGPYASLAEAKAAGAVTVNYGVFVNAVVSFLIVAFCVFLLVKAVNSMQRTAKPAPPAPTPTEALLAEIRDLLRRPASSASMQ